MKADRDKSFTPSASTKRAISYNRVHLTKHDLHDWARVEFPDLKY